MAGSNKVEYSAADLSAMMVGKDTLQGWDVLVAYQVDALNKLLAAQHAGLKAAQITFDVKYRDPDEEVDKERTYNLQLGTPTMRILDSQSAVQVNFPLSGDSKRKDLPTPARALPSGLTLACKTKFLNLTGERLDKDPKGLSSSTPAGEIVVLEPNVSATSYVALDLTRPEIAISPDAVLNALIKAPLENHLNSSGIKYILTGVSNHTPPGGSFVLKPTKFVMTTVVDDYVTASDSKTASGSTSTAHVAAKSSLLMWIALEGSASSPRQNTANSPLLFTPGTTQISPIPSEFNASIIIAHDTMYQKLIKSQVGKSLSTVVSCTSTAGSQTPGMSFTAKLKADSVDVPRYEDKSEDKMWCDEIKFSLDTEASTLVLNNKTPMLDFSYTKNDVSFGQYKLYSDSTGFGNRKWQEGKASFTFKMHGTGKWSESASNLALVFTLPDHLDVDVNANDPGWYYRTFGGKLKDVLPAMKRTKATITNVTLDFGGIDYFLTTNLLIPGSEVFQASSVGSGFYMPRDSLICGNLIAPPKASNSSTGQTAAAPSMMSNMVAEPLLPLETIPSAEVTSVEEESPTRSENKGTIASFRKALCQTNPPSDFRKAIMAILLSKDPVAENKFEEVMETFGFHKITPEDIDRMVNLQGSRNNVDATDAIAPQFQAATASTVDDEFAVGVFGGLYRITSPRPPVQELMLNSQTGEVNMGDSIYQTSATVDTTGNMKVLWKAVDNSSYDVQFFTKYNGDRKEFEISFTGQRTESNGTVISEFNGVRVSRRVREDPKKLKEANGWTVFVYISTIVGFIAGIPALIACVIKIKKVIAKHKKKAKVAPTEAERHESENREKEERSKLEVVIDIEQKHQVDLARTLQARDSRAIATVEQRNQLIHDLRTNIDSLVQDHYERTYDIWNHPEIEIKLDHLDSTLRTQINRRIEEVVRVWANAAFGPNIRQFVEGFAAGAMLDQSAVEAVALQAVDLQRTQLVDQMTNANGLYREIINMNISESMLNFSQEVQRGVIERADFRIPNLIDNATNASAAVDQALQEAEANRKRLEDNNLNHTDRQDLEMEKTKLENTIKERSERAIQERKALEVEQARKTEAEAKSQKLEESKTETERMKKEAERKFKAEH